MGAEQSRNRIDPPSFESLPDMVGCDTKGTILCKDSKLTCLNGGVCALFLKEVEDACEERCKCPRDYIGDYCQFYAGFYTATIGLVIGLFLTILFVIFIAICIWYCCNRKKRKNDSLESGHRAPDRAYLSNRVANPKNAGPLDFQVQTMNSAQYGEATPIDLELRNPQVPNDSTSRSFSIYDNVVWNEEDTNWLNDEQNTTLQLRDNGDCNAIPETSQLLGYDSADRQQHTQPLRSQTNTENVTRSPTVSAR